MLRCKVVLRMAALIVGACSGLLAATVVVRFVPPTVSVTTPSFTVDLMADIPPATPVIGWGVHITFDASILALESATVDAAWFPAGQDGFAGLAFPASLAGSRRLATLHFRVLKAGSTGLHAVVNSADLSQGFPFPVGGFADTTLMDGLVTVIDKTPPTISGMPSACTLWPPNHDLIKVAVVSAADNLSGVASFAVTAVSNEPEDGLGDGDTAPDVVITGSGIQPRVVQLRAERSGTGSGRVYTITATATDGSGNTATAQSTCTVPHNK